MQAVSWMTNKSQAVAAAAFLLLAASQVTAGDALGWSVPAGLISDSGVAAGTALTVLGVVLTGAALWFGMTAMLTLTLPMTFGGIVMASADAIASTLFGAGGGGGLVTGYVPGLG